MSVSYQDLFEAFRNALKSEKLTGSDLKGTDERTLTDLYNQLVSILGQLDITLSSLRDALRGTDARTLTDLYNRVATETTLSGIKTQTDKFTFDTYNYLKTSPRSNIEVKDETVASGEIFDIPSGMEYAWNNLNVSGKYFNYGVTRIYGTLTIKAGGRVKLGANSILKFVR